jgi:Flp pilus assembly pilin Flp
MSYRVESTHCRCWSPRGPLDPSEHGIFDQLLPLVLARLSRAIGDDCGQDLAEYALLAALVAVAVGASVQVFGDLVGTWWTELSTAISALIS